MPAYAPGPPALPLLGHSIPFLRDKLGFLERCARQYGDVVQLSLGGTTFLLVHPSDIRHVLAGNAANYGKSPRVTGARSQERIGRNVLTTEGTEHQRLRRALQPLFRQGVLEPFGPLIVKHAEAAAAEWLAKGTIDAAAEMRALAARCAATVLLGDATVRRFPSIVDAVEARRRYIDGLFSSLLPRPHLWPTQTNLEQRRNHTPLLRMLEAAIEAATNGGGPSLLSVLMRDNETLTRQEICAQLLALSVAAYETIAELLTWTAVLLAQHPHHAVRIVEEVEIALGGRALSSADVPHLHSTQQVLSEALRLYPPTWMFVRIARSADVLPSGTNIPAGAKIYLSQYVTHRDPRFFPNPERFDPTRFSEEAGRTRPPFAFFPFGGGPRLCLGESLDRTEAALIFATIARRLQLELVHGQSIKAIPGVTLRPFGCVRMIVRPR